MTHPETPESHQATFERLVAADNLAMKSTVMVLDAVAKAMQPADITVPKDSEPDGPIREPGDESPEWGDVYTVEQLVAACDYQAAQIALRGGYESAAEIRYAGKAIADLAEVRDFLRGQIQLYRNGRNNALAALATAQARIAELEREIDGADFSEDL